MKITAPPTTFVNFCFSLVEDLLSKQLGTAAVEAVVEDAEDEEGALEEEVDEGPVDGRGVIRMLLGVMGGWHPGVGGGRKS